MADENWKPKIIAIICNWCSYAGADLAGGARIQYPPDIRAVRVMCTGRIDPLFILKAFQDGADGVLVSGCHFGDCHYLEGNYKAAKRMFLLKSVLKNIGLDDKRLRMTFVSASEGAKWGMVMEDVVKTINELGPSPLKEFAR
ncbi:hydrogenase iron-sulfur subunit [Methanoculleus bourgensis]|jgi:F420-non-reducing hydrogenase iron-sulfur subunit|uniref:F420-non-reducing hydrogenase vhc iron-sulfur subunit D n=1 Tax=Methanoculleus bourgensis TaxID=83986 RepID=A0A0X3BMX3_9EURY|nr:MULTISPECIES: hydrogenase iron-sulfur subunit [Methanoculleus]MBT0732209.1 hydrogenase iron-sulfur subunit [Methanoculleus bourgensis]MCK8517966.1 hydrogenase iron-sulfur subunit [Methanoculleus sp. 7T]MDD3372213.1 hydrogenase iron-sulfur subunit [Methanoculleus bourgensis]NMA88579.1 hydrogenase iron-sulfur subunit [Methanoculleus bourgensis]NQS77301.1 hydrogenase iron-sulfur subunit [Methanoculleus bourgensis]